MKKIDVKKLARMLRVLVIIVFACNLIALFFVPALAAMSMVNGWDGQTMERLLTGELGIRLDFCIAAWHPFVWIMSMSEGDFYWPVLTLFLLICGVCTAIILWQAKRVLDTIIKENPFTQNNAKNLKRAAVCCFVISGAALVRLVWSLFYYRSPAPLATYNALFVPIFLMAGLLCMVMSALFRQAAELKEENDLTI